jgi:hypothetical protein
MVSALFVTVKMPVKATGLSRPTSRSSAFEKQPQRQSADPSRCSVAQTVHNVLAASSIASNRLEPVV